MGVDFFYLLFSLRLSLIFENELRTGVEVTFLFGRNITSRIWVLAEEVNTSWRLQLLCPSRGAIFLFLKLHRGLYGFQASRLLSLLA